MVEFTGIRHADTPTLEVEMHIEASPDCVWQFVSDIHVLPPLSNELQAVEWQDGATGPVVGARFTGYNKREDMGEWQTTSIVTQCEAPRVFAWAVGNVERPAAVWRFTLEPSGSGTVLRQWVQMGPGPSGLTMAIERWPEKEQKIVFVRLREYEAAMRANLAHIKAVAEL